MIAKRPLPDTPIFCLDPQSIVEGHVDPEEYVRERGYDLTLNEIEETYTWIEAFLEITVEGMMYLLPWVVDAWDRQDDDSWIAEFFICKLSYCGFYRGDVRPPVSEHGFAAVPTLLTAEEREWTFSSLMAFINHVETLKPGHLLFMRNLDIEATKEFWGMEDQCDLS